MKTKPRKTVKFKHERLPVNNVGSVRRNLVGDRPIKSENEDVLGFGSFADALAKSLMGTSNNCPRASGTPNLPVNDSALFSFRFCAVHPKDARDCLPRQLFEVPKDNVAGFEYALARSNPLIFHGNLSGIGDDGMVIPFHQFQPPTKRKRCEKFTPCLYKRATALLIRIKLLVGPAE